MDSEVLEGKSLKLTVKVLDSNNNPLSNKLVFAEIVNFFGQAFPLNYVPDYNGFEFKKLLCPIPGVYLANPDSLDQYTILYPILTNNTGMVTFKNL